MKYTGVKCLHPRKSFKNGYCQYFPCGHCEVCLSNKSFNNESLCDFELSSCACAFFVTLTFDDAHIPVAMVLHDGDNYFRCYDVTTRYRLIDGIDLLDRFDDGAPDDTPDRFLGSFTMPFNMFRNMARKVRLKTYPFDAYDKRNIWHLPYLSVIDHKNFLKRFRKLYDEKFNPEVPEVRYFCLGEYGPQSFRPHWHYLLFISKKRTSEEIERLLFESWKFGRVSIDFVEGSPNSYITSYAAGSNLVSPFHRLHLSRPRVLHSKYFGGSVLDCVQYKNRDDVQGEPFVTDEISLDMFGRIKSYWVRRQVEIRRFPKCPGYAKKSVGLRCVSYMLYARALRGFLTMNGCFPTSFKDLSDWLTELSFTSIDADDFCPGLHDGLHDLVNYYRDNFSKKDDVTCELLPFTRDVCRDYLMRELYISHKFYEAYNLPYTAPPHRVLEFVYSLDVYYKNIDYENLKNNLECLETYSKSWPFETLKVAFYALPDIEQKYLDASLRKCVPYNRYVGKIYENFYEYRKHKDLNDANDIFIYDGYDHSSKTNYSRIFQKYITT